MFCYTLTEKIVVLGSVESIPTSNSITFHLFLRLICLDWMYTYQYKAQHWKRKHMLAEIRYYACAVALCAGKLIVYTLLILAETSN